MSKGPGEASDPMSAETASNLGSEAVSEEEEGRSHAAAHLRMATGSAEAEGGQVSLEHSHSLSASVTWRDGALLWITGLVDLYGVGQSLCR